MTSFLLLDLPTRWLCPGWPEMEFLNAIFS
jgi:hypothetical protein